MNIQNILLENEAVHEENDCLKKRVEILTVERKNLLQENNALKKKLDNLTLWDLSPKAQEEAGHALAKDLLGR